MRVTDLFIVLDDETLNTMKGKRGKTAKFENEEEANMAAGNNLDIWTVVNVYFEHQFIQHKL